MDHWKTPEALFHHRPQPQPSADEFAHHSSSQRVETEIKDTHVARKVQKADREKLRRDRLNEQFVELGNALDPDRPKNDKATILTDAILMLKDLTRQVSSLKAEYTSLSDESHELTQEKNELREEKVKLKSDIDGLQAQYQQRLRIMFPWTAVDPTLMMGPPPPYPCAMPLPVPSSQIPVHPPLHPYAFFPNQNAVGPCAPFLSYYPACNSATEQRPGIGAPSHPQPSSSRSQTSCLQDSTSKFCDQQRNYEKADDSGNVATELELKTPGSSLPESKQEESCSSKDRKEQLRASPTVRNDFKDASSSNRGTSANSLHDCSDSVGDGSVAEN